MAGINLDAMRAKYNKLTTKGGSADGFWKPQEGSQTIRIVAPTDGDPFRDYLFHYRLGADQKTTLISPRTFNLKDPIGDFGNKLWNEDTEESRAMARNFFPKMRVFAPVIVRGEEEKGVRLWGFSKTTYEALLKVVLDPEYGDIADPNTGTDLRLNYGKKVGQMYPTTELMPARKSSPLGTEEQIENFLANVPNFDEQFPATTTEQAQKLLDETLSGGADADASDGTTRYGGKGAVTTETTTNVTDIETAFDDLLA